MSELDLARAVRQACVEAMIDGYDGARLSGLCQQGAWDVALDRVVSLDLEALVESFQRDRHSICRRSGSNS